MPISWKRARSDLPSNASTRALQVELECDSKGTTALLRLTIMVRRLLGRAYRLGDTGPVLYPRALEGGRSYTLRLPVQLTFAEHTHFALSEIGRAQKRIEQPGECCMENKTCPSILGWA